MGQTKIGVPTVKGVGGALADFAYGLGGGVVYALATSLFGNSLIGGALGAGLAGSVIKGERGTMLATILGFQGMVGTLGATSQAQATATTDSRGVL